MARGCSQRGRHRPRAATPAPSSMDVPRIERGSARGVLRMASPASVSVHSRKSRPRGEGPS